MTETPGAGMTAGTAETSLCATGLGKQSRFVLSAAAMCAFCGLLTAAPVTLKRGEGQIDVSIGGRPFTTYYFSKAVAKPYLMPLRTATGIVISRNFPIANAVTAADQKTRSF